MPGYAISAGTVIENNDPRKRGERREVIQVANGYAYYQAGVRRAKVSLDRIMPPGQRNANGWSVVSPVFPQCGVSQADHDRVAKLGVAVTTGIEPFNPGSVRSVSIEDKGGVASAETRTVEQTPHCGDRAPARPAYQAPVGSPGAGKVETERKKPSWGGTVNGSDY